MLNPTLTNHQLKLTHTTLKQTLNKKKNFPGGIETSQILIDGLRATSVAI